MGRKLSQMDAVAELRAKLGLTQLQMAQFLQVSPSYIAMAETGKRELPTAALLKLAEMELFLHQPAAKKQTARPHEKRQQETGKQLLEQQAQELYYKHEYAKRKLHKMEEAYAQKLALLDFITHLKEKNSDAGKSNPAIPPQWLDLMEMEVLEDLEKNGLHVQAILRTDVAALNLHLKQSNAALARITANETLT